MNHWISKHQAAEVCAACKESVPNASGLAGVQVTGHCLFGSDPEFGVFCEQCVELPPLLGRYAMRELEWHGGFCEQCGRFVGDTYRPVNRQELAKLVAKEAERQAAVAAALETVIEPSGVKAPVAAPARSPEPYPTFERLDRAAYEFAALARTARWLGTIAFLAFVLYEIMPRLTHSDIVVLALVIVVATAVAYLVDRWTR